MPALNAEAASGSDETAEKDDSCSTQARKVGCWVELQLEVGDAVDTFQPVLSGLTEQSILLGFTRVTP